MAEFTKDVRIPKVTVTELNDSTAEVTIIVPGLMPSQDKFKPKNGNVSFDWFNDCNGFAVEIEIRDKEAKARTIWAHQVDRLPTKINRRDSKWTVEDGKLVITMVKAVAEPWMKKVMEKGLDQAGSSDSEAESENEQNDT